MQFDLLCGQSVRRQLDFGKPDETANYSAAFELGYFFLTKAKVLCQIFRVFLQLLFLVRPFDFSSFNFFPKIGKTLFCRLSERDFRRNPFHKEKAAAEAPLPPSLNGQLSVISQIFSFYLKRPLTIRLRRKQRAVRSKEQYCCCLRSGENSYRYLPVSHQP